MNVGDWQEWVREARQRVTDAAGSAAIERRKRGIPRPLSGGALALCISIGSRMGRAKIPVGIGAAEAPESDHDEIPQLAGTHRR
jgi:hypothetical protein